MRVEMRYATAADYAALHGEANLPFTRYGFALALDGMPVALACLRYDKGRYLLGSVDLKPEARRHPLALHRWAKKVLEVVGRMNVRSFVVIADSKIPRSEAWIERLGFSAIGETETGTVYQWQVSQ